MSVSRPTARSFPLRATASAAALLAWLTGVAACGSSPPPRPPGLPPTPASITRENPGGDAADPERAALERLLSEPWGRRRDRFNTLDVPLVDWKSWRRVRIWNHPTRATYRYGDAHHALVTVLYTDTSGPSDPDSCLDEFWAKHAPLADAYGVRLGEAQLIRTTQEIDGEVRPLVLKLLDGSLESVFASDAYAGAIAAYESWPGTCLVSAMAVKSSHHPELARRVRDRWVDEGAPRLRWTRRITEAPTTDAR
ncbi:hypothetical protein SOCEGT47_067950 [Sorangium cellulosum]|uniref:Secreted protein n=1 Tax=Sorangium cellulosum TaxID=56 RepID=A0A4P2Q9E1_SORCE|nr:hypothetical protein [Sorangium cellulosum]AUX26234.1 hypothetical protein SOCEGT47_067950 [Sorangium cellulosum]